MQLGSDPDELAPPYLPSDQQQQPKNQTPNLQDMHSRTIRCFVQGCHSILDTFVVATPMELRYGPTVTFVRAVYGIKGLMLLQLALARMPRLRTVLGDLEIQYQAYLGAMKRQLVITSSDFACKVPSKVLELTTFLAERNSLEVNLASSQLLADEGYQQDSANAFVGGNQGLCSGQEGDFLETVAKIGHDRYLLAEGTYGEYYGSEFDMLQMPDLGNFSYIANHGFGFDEASAQGCWNPNDIFAIASWTT